MSVTRTRRSLPRPGSAGHRATTAGLLWAGLAFAATAVILPGHAAGAQLAGPPRVEDACSVAIRAVEAGARLPPGLLGSIGRVESGRVDPGDGVVKPWPWTVNAEGRGMLFDSKAEAIAAVVGLQARGVTAIDVGCMQIDLAYHPAAFATLDDAFEPLRNVTYAARFLRELFAITADWPAATARYHSSTPDLGLPYMQKVLGMTAVRPCPPVPPRPRDQLAAAWGQTLVPAGRSDPGGWDRAPPLRATPPDGRRAPPRPAFAAGKCATALAALVR